MRSDIERAVERYTEQCFRQAYEGRCTSGPEPEQYCSICGDNVVDEPGMCEFCASPAQVEERAEFEAWLNAKAEAHLIMQAVDDATMLTDSEVELMTMAMLSDVIAEMRGEVKGAA